MATEDGRALDCENANYDAAAEYDIVCSSKRKQKRLQKQQLRASAASNPTATPGLPPPESTSSPAGMTAAANVDAAPPLAWWA